MPENHVLFRYAGPLTGFTIAGEDETQPARDVILNDGAEILLPPSHPFVQELVTAKRLTTVPPSSLGAEPGIDAPVPSRRRVS